MIFHLWIDNVNLCALAGCHSKPCYLKSIDGLLTVSNSKKCKIMNTANVNAVLKNTLDQSLNQQHLLTQGFTFLGFLSWKMLIRQLITFLNQLFFLIPVRIFTLRHARSLVLASLNAINFFLNHMRTQEEIWWFISENRSICIWNVSNLLL